MADQNYFKTAVGEEDDFGRNRNVFQSGAQEKREVGMVKLASISECGSLISVNVESIGSEAEAPPDPNNQNEDAETGKFVASPPETDEAPPKYYNPAHMVNIKHRRCCLGSDCIGTIFCATLTLVALAYSLYWFGHRMPMDSYPNINLTCMKPEITRSSGGQLNLNYTLNVAFEPPTSVVAANYEIQVFDKQFRPIGTSKLKLFQASSINGDQTFTQVVHGIGSVRVSLPFLDHIPLSHTILAVFNWEEVDYTHCNKESCPWSKKNHTTFLDVECSIAKKW